MIPADWGEGTTMMKYLGVLLVLIPAAVMAQSPAPPDADPPTTITITNKPPPSAAMRVQVVTPISVGRPHVCAEAYSLEALEQMAEGKTILSFHVGTDGHVKNPAVMQSSGNALLDTASIACASTWNYKPATTDGAPVEVPWKAQIIWKVGAPAQPAAPVAPCNQFVAANHKVPDDISARSSVVLLVMPDGSVVPEKIVASSGDTVLDAAAMRCVAARHYKPANGIVPPAGRALYTIVDWRQELAPATAFAATTPAANPVPTGTPHFCMNDYPLSAIWDGAEGNVQLAFKIAADGTVKNVTIVKSSGNDDLDAAAAGCAGRWTYKPVIRDGVAVEVPWRAMVEWKLHATDAEMRPCARYHAVTPELLNGIGGVTKVSFRIMPDGSVKQPEIVDSSGNAELDQAALRCIADRHYNTQRAVISDTGVPKDARVDWRVDTAK
jgi:TonB family protein